MHRSELTIDLAALRRNARTLLRALGGAELWAVVKANGYGHGAADVAGAALDAGATALCVATVAEASTLRHEFPTARIIVMGPRQQPRDRRRRATRALELVVSTTRCPTACASTSSSTPGWGAGGSRSSTPARRRRRSDEPSRDRRHRCGVRGVADRALPRETAAVHAPDRHIANSAGALRYPSARFDAARCGIALYGLSPFGTDPADDGLEPVLAGRATSRSAGCCTPGESTGYGRRFIAERDTWIGIVPVGYADGFRRDLTGTRGARRGRAAACGRDDLDGCLRGRARPRAAGRHAGHADRSRHARGGARPGRGDDHLRARRAASAAIPPRARRVVVDG